MGRQRHDRHRPVNMPELTLNCVDLDDTDTLSAPGNLWYRAYNSNGPVIAATGYDTTGRVATLLIQLSIPCQIPSGRPLAQCRSNA